MPPAANTSSRPARRRAAAAVALLLAALAACSRGPEPVREEIQVFGTLTDIEIRGADPARARAAVAEIAQALQRRQAEWHAWEPSDLTRINAALARGEPATAPQSVLELVARSRPLSDATDGLFDPAVGGLIALWGFHTSEFPVRSPAPDPALVDQWRAGRPRLSQLQVRGNQLSSDNPRLQLDFGAIAEGFAAEEALAILRRHGIRHALVGMGGDLVALGDGDGRPWRAGLRDPFGGVLGSIDLGDGEALFSTGNYNKFRDSPSGGRWSHILDPRTGMPARGAAAVVVLHPDPVLADASATALFVAGPAGFEALVRRLRLGCALMVSEENELLVTEAMRARLSLLREPVPLGEPLPMGPDCRAP